MRDVFKYYDANADYLIDRTQMIYVLQDIGALDHMEVQAAASYIAAEFSRLDTESIGRVHEEQFCVFFATVFNALKRKGLWGRAPRKVSTPWAPLNPHPAPNTHGAS